MRRVAQTAFHHAGPLQIGRWANRKGLRILMYHRFEDGAQLDRQCEHIRAHYAPVSMSAVAGWLQHGRPLPQNALAITVDDGYRDFLTVGYPVFVRHRIPATVFLVSDFLDGKRWLWTDVVRYAVENAGVSKAEIELSSSRMSIDLESHASRSAAIVWIKEAVKRLSRADQLEVVARLPQALQSRMPESLPAAIQPLAWDEVRAMAEEGLVEFGAHTRTHPILSSLTSAEELRDEIAGCKARARSKRPWVLRIASQATRMTSEGFMLHLRVTQV